MNLLDVMSVLEKCYCKILVINVKENSYKIIKMDKNEAILHTEFIQWWIDFADENIHPEDKDRYLNFIDTFQNGSILFYRRKCGVSWKWIAAEFLETNNSISMNPEYILLIRESDKGIIKALSDSNSFESEKRILKDKKEWHDLTQINNEKLYAFYIKSNKILEIESIIQTYFADVVAYQIAIDKLIIITKLDPIEFRQQVKHIQKDISDNNIYYNIGAAQGKNLLTMTNIAINNMKNY